MEFRTLLLFLFCLLIPNYVFAALGISQDETPDNYFHWSSAMHFDVDANTVSDQLPSLARQAYEEMRGDAKDQKGLLESQIPSTMAALAIGSNVYFSSGLIGAPFLVNPGAVENYVQEGVADEVATAIVRCQHAFNSEHRYDLRCAEPIAAQQFLVNNPTVTIVGQGKISTYGNLDKDDVNNVGILNPCQTDKYGRWGCQVFLDKLDITRVGNQNDKPDLPSISPQDPQNPPLPHCFWT